MILRLCIAITAMALVIGVAPSQEQPQWLLIKSSGKPGVANKRTLATFGWKKLARAYLKRNYRIVSANAPEATAEATKATSRLVAGTPTNNVVVKQLATQLGITWKQGKVHYAGGAWADDAGIALITDDPDGRGKLVLLAGKTEAAACHCLSVPIDLGGEGFVVMTFRKALQRGAVAGGNDNNTLTVAPDTLRVVRLDRELFRIRREYADSIDEAALQASRAFAGHHLIFERCLTPRVDLYDYTRQQLSKNAKLLDRTESRFAEVDLEALLKDIDRQVTTALGGREGPRPIVYIVVTGHGTNAQVIGQDPQTMRMRMTLNLAMFDNVDALRLAATHEFVHTLQRGGGDTLLDQAIREGVATYLSQQLIKGTSDHDALMWTAKKLAAANQRSKPILAEFRRLRNSRDRRQTGKFLHAETPLRGVAGAPDRCGYWIGWRAVAAFCAKHPNRPLHDLLRMDAETIFAALE